jgi:hypothetical protein
MTPPRSDTSAARLSESEPEAMLTRVAGEGARSALSDVGLGGKDAVLTIHDIRALFGVHPVRAAHRGQTAVHVVTTGALIARLVAIAMQLR